MEQNLGLIIEGCLSAKSDAQQQLYKYCFPQMMRVCERYFYNEQDSANAYNESMYQVLSKIKQYKGEGEFMGWVRRIFVNTCINILKREQKHAFSELTSETLPKFSITPDVYNKTNEQDILAMVKELPRQTAIVFNLHIIEGYTHAQIAELIAISENTSKWHVNNARNLLKASLLQKKSNETFEHA